MRCLLAWEEEDDKIETNKFNFTYLYWINCTKLREEWKRCVLDCVLKKKGKRLHNKMVSLTSHHLYFTGAPSWLLCAYFLCGSWTPPNKKLLQIYHPSCIFNPPRKRIPRHLIILYTPRRARRRIDCSSVRGLVTTPSRTTKNIIYIPPPAPYSVNSILVAFNM